MLNGSCTSSGEGFLVGHTGSFTNGVYSHEIILEEGLTGCRVTAMTGSGITGHCREFNVVPLDILAINLDVMDIAWWAPSNAIVASVAMTDPLHPNQLVFLDPADLTVRAAIPVGKLDPNSWPGYVEGKLVLDAPSQRIFLAVSNATTLQSVNLSSGATTTLAVMERNIYNRYWSILDFAPVPGHVDQVIISRTDGSRNNTALFMNGTPRQTQLQNTGQSARYNLLTGSNPGQVIANVSVGNGLEAFLGLSTLSGQIQVVASNVIEAPHGTWRLLGTPTQVISEVGYRADRSTLIPLEPLVRPATGSYRAVADELALAYAIETVIHGKEYAIRAQDIASGLLRKAVPIKMASPFFEEIDSATGAGTNGIALGTTDGRLLRVRSPVLGRDGPAAELTMNWQPLDPPLLQGQLGIVRLSVFNGGPALATDVSVRCQISEMLGYLKATGTVVPPVVLGSEYRFELGNLAANQATTLDLEFVPLVSGEFRLRADLSANEWSPNPAAGVIDAIIPVEHRLQPGSWASMKLDVTDLNYDPNRQVVVASQPGSPAQATGIVREIDAATGRWGQAITTPSKPGSIAVSDVGGFAHVIVAGGAEVASYDMIAGQWVGETVVGTNSTGKTLYGSRIRSIPGSELRFALDRSFRPYEHIPDYLSLDSIAVFDDGSLLPELAVPSLNTGLSGLYVVAPDGQKLLVPVELGHQEVQLDDFDIGQSGLTPSGSPASALGVSAFAELQHGGAFLADSLAQLIASAPPHVVTKLMPAAGNIPFAVDPAAGRVYYLTNRWVAQFNAEWHVAAFDGATGTPLGSEALGTMPQSAARKLVLWGVDGLAIRRDDGILVFGRTALRTKHPEANLALEHQAAGLAIATSNLVVSVTVHNHGPGAAVTPRLLAEPVGNLEILEVFTNKGACVIRADGQVFCELETISDGGSTSIVFTLLPTLPDASQLRLRLAGFSIDPVSADNLSDVQIEAGYPAGEPVLHLMAPHLMADDQRGTLLVAAQGTADTNEFDLLVINPFTRATVATTPLGRNAGKLAMTGSGEQLYTWLDGDKTMLKVDAETLAKTPYPSSGSGPFEGTIWDYDSVAGDDAALLMAFDSVFGSEGSRSGVWKDGAILQSTHYQRRSVVTSKTEPVGWVLGSSDVFKLGLNDEGVSLVNDITQSSTGGYAKHGPGRLFGQNGGIINDSTLYHVHWLGNCEQIEPDYALRRIFTLDENDDHTATISMYDWDTFAFLGSEIVRFVLAPTFQFVRWGEDGLAFSTQAGQLFVWRSSLLVTEKTADLELRLTSLPLSPDYDDSSSAVVEVVNHGPDAAEQVTMGVRIQPNTINEFDAWGSAWSEGELIPSGGEQNVTLLIPRLEAGRSAWLHVETDARHRQPLIQVASAASRAADPNPLNNTRATTNQFRSLPLEAGTAFRVVQPHVDIEFCPANRRLYISLPNNDKSRPGTVLEFDVDRAREIRRFATGSQPGKMAVSLDGQYLYVNDQATRSIQQIDLTSGQQVRSWSLGEGVSAMDLLVPEGQPERIAVSRYRYSPALNSVTLYDAGIALPQEVTTSGGPFQLIRHTTGKLLANHENPPFEILEIDVTELGLTETASHTDIVNWHYDVPVYFDGLLMTPSGKVFSTATWSQVGLVENGPYPNSWRPAIVALPDFNRAYILSHGRYPDRLEAFDLNDFSMTGSYEFNQFSGGGYPHGFAYCGAGLLVWSSGVDLMFWRVQDIPSTDVSPVHPRTLWTLLGEPLEIALGVRNAGDVPAINTVLRLQMPAGVIYQSAAPPTLDVTSEGDDLIVSLGLIPARSSASFALHFLPTGMNPGWHNVGLIVASDTLEGYSPDNSSLLPLIVDEDADADGIPDLLEKAYWPGSEHFLHSAEEDSDLDGASNEAEFWAGTNPNDSDSRLFLGLPSIKNGTVLLRFPNQTDLPLIIESRSSLAVDWQLLDQQTQPGQGGQVVVDLVSPSQPMKIYRLRIP